MIRITKYILSTLTVALALCGLWSCADDPLDGMTRNPENAVTFNDDGTMNVSVNLEVPDLLSAATRAMGRTPDYENLKLYMLVFEEGEGLKQYAQLTPENPQSDDIHGHNGLVAFKAILEPTEKNAVLHFIATDQPDFYKNIGFGTEERVITALYTDGNHEAYWQRRAPGCNIPGKEDVEADHDGAKAKAQKIAGLLSHIPMVRNFCRVSVKLSDKAMNINKFKLKGLYVLNTVDRGSVAPYVAGNPSGSRFVDYYAENPAAGTGYSGLSYDTVSAQNHIGTLPTGVLLINTSTDESEIGTKSECKDPEGSNTLDPVYFYERPARVNSTQRTFVIIKGNLNNSEKDSYYKLDLGYVKADDVVGRFEYYNLLRNFDYSININSVESSGYASLEEAAKGAVFNNFSASVEARNMKSISDGDDMIFVNFTSHVFTQPGQVKELLAQYRTDIGTANVAVHNDYIHCLWEAGDVIANIKEPEPDEIKNDIDSWNTYTVTGQDPTEQLKQQVVYIYRGNKAGEGEPVEYGLYRVITFFSHTPWSFVHMDTFPGLWESPDDMPSWEWGEEYREIGQSKGSPLTLFFELPAGLPQALFPLDFVIESDRQNIQNAYQGNAVVRSVPASESLFKDNPTIVGKPTTARIQYVKTVTWEDYNGELSEEQVGKGSAIVRCRFLTITDLEQDGIGDDKGQSETTLRVYNEYFGQENNGVWTMYHQDGFKRDNNTSNPSPRFWDFSSGIWDVIMYQMNQKDRDVYNAGNNVTDELIFIEGASATMTNDIDENTGMRYVLANRGDGVMHKLKYSNTRQRTMRVSVMSTDVNGNTAAPTIGFTNVTDGTMSAPTTYTSMDDSGAYPSYIYDIPVPQNITYLELNITAPMGGLRLYKIDFYPRWDEYETE